HTLSGGRLVYVQGDLRAEPGHGRYVKRPPFGPVFDALSRKAALQAPTAVARSA
ncbi:dihydropyrimidinase, partial [Klebsiella pneumoniae]|nr:dihydropyrimidinase [Klebsiella pneumoniae]